MGKKILVINGPNLEMLGKRDKSTYGDFSLESLEKLITEEANTLGCQVEFFQNNIEGEIINKLNEISKANGWNLVRWITRENNSRAKALYDRVSEKSTWDVYELK